MARIWEFLGSPSFEELKGRTLYDLVSEKEEELQRLQTRCALLEQLLLECMRHYKASLLRRERLLSILAGGSEKSDFGIRAYRWSGGGLQKQ